MADSKPATSRGGVSHAPSMLSIASGSGRSSPGQHRRRQTAERAPRTPSSTSGGGGGSSGWSAVQRMAGKRTGTGTMSRGSSSVWGISSIAGGGGARRRKGRAGGGGTGTAGDGGFVPATVVRDEEGRDVTPKSLLSLKPTALMQHNELADLQFHSSSRASSAGSSEFGDRSTYSFALGLADTRSVSSVMSTPRTVVSESVDSAQQQQQQQSGTSVPSASVAADAMMLMAGAGAASAAGGGGGEAVVVIEREGDAEMQAESLDALVTIKLSETETEWLLDIEGASIDESSPFAEDARERNASYEALCKRNALGNESLVNREMQTVGTAHKSKEVQTSPPRQRDAGTQASEAGIFDDATSGTVASSPPAVADSAASTSTLDKDPGSFVDVDPSDASSEALETRRLVELDRIQHSSEVVEALRTLERVVMQNEDQRLLKLYKRGFSEGEGSGQVIEPLWRYEAGELTKDRNVSCVVWNNQLHDTIAVGYGEYDCRAREEQSTSGKGGLILIWSLASIRHPDYIVRTPSDVTALSFSTRHPSLLAAGMGDGNVVVYSLQAHGKAVALSAPAGRRGGGAGDPIWEVRWNEQAADVGESLVSAGASGRVLLWGLRRGLEVRGELMHLSNVHNPAKSHGAGAGAGAGALRHAGALSLDMHPTTRGVYLVATDGGLLHKCSASYSDQYLQTYIGHVGPVVCVRWSPFSPSTFVSAGSDWTIRVWDHDRGSAPAITVSLDPASRSSSTTATVIVSEQQQQQQQTQQPTADEEKEKLHQHYHPLVPVPEFPTDICWSPVSSTVLVCTCGSSLQIWDLAQSTMDPIFTLCMPGNRAATCVAFSATSDILVAGCADGSTTVFRVNTAKLYGHTIPADKQRDTLEDLVEAAFKQTR